MSSLNKVMLIGNITKPHEIKRTANNLAVLNFTLAINSTYKEKNDVTFVEITCFDKTAENIAKYTSKGSKLFVEGRLKLDKWENEKGKFQKLNVVAEHFVFLDNKNQSDASKLEGYKQIAQQDEDEEMFLN